MTDLDAYERRFRRDGLPLFIEDRSAREDVWTRAAPLLALVFIGEMLGAIKLDWSLLANLAATRNALWARRSSSLSRRFSSDNR